MLHIPYAAFWFAQVTGEGLTGKAKGFFGAAALKALAFAGNHPVYTGLIGGVAGMLVVYALRKALWASAKWVVGIPMAALKVAFRPIAAVCRKVRGKAMARARRLPMIGEVAYLGPCSNCGSKKEYTVRTTGYVGGTVRGYDTITGRPVLGCPDCCRT